MREIKLILCLLVVSLFACNQQVLERSEPAPFGLKLGVSTKQETLSVIKKEGGRVVKKRSKMIEGNIVNPNVEGVEVEGLPINNLTSATFWFYKGKLYKIEYGFAFPSMYELTQLLNKLKEEYGAADFASNTLAEWNFGDVKVQLIIGDIVFILNKQFIITALIYEHKLLSREVQKSEPQAF